MTHIAAAASLLGLIGIAQSFPLYSQQCSDDAGPPFADDEPGTQYHDGSAAYPILVGPNENQCPPPLAAACQSRGSAKTAFLEGPIDCAGGGWYCRILPDDDFDDIALSTDYNAHHCNRTDDLFEAPDDLHCHGGSDESTYYWWVRDHWFRQYNGRLRCCCGWDTLRTGFLTNRCDYRRLVAEGEAGGCRDANEDNDPEYYPLFEDGCDDAIREGQAGSPIEEDDCKCWEVKNFGFVEGGGTVPAIPDVAPGSPDCVATPTTYAPTESETEAPSESPVEATDAPTAPPVPAECFDDEEFNYRGTNRTCEWASQIICRKKLRDGTDNRVRDYCRDPDTCDGCDPEIAGSDGCVNEEPFPYRNGEENCDWVETWCDLKTRKDGNLVRDHCRESCGNC